MQATSYTFEEFQMTIDWDSIKYVFQIPAKWYKEIQERVFHAYGEDFIRVRQDGEAGGLAIGIDK